MINNLQSLSQAKKINNKIDWDEQLTNNTNLKLFNSNNKVESERKNTEEHNETHLHFKSGVIYDGLIKNNLKTGHGLFIWPNGDAYNGEFILNYRNGRGIYYY